MFCTKCGEKLEDGSVFCTSCGARLDESQDMAVSSAVSGDSVQEGTASGVQGENGTAKGLSKETIKLIGIGAAALVALFLVIKLIGGLFSGSLDEIVTVYDSEKEETFVYLNGKNIGSVDGSASVYTNMDRSGIYVLSSNDSTLYFVKGKKLVEVMDECSSVVIANHAKTAMVIDTEGTLSKYNGKKLEEISDENVVSAVISGDGKYYAYSCSEESDDSDDDSWDDYYDYDYEEESGNYTSYFGKKAGKETEVDEVKIIALSENGKYIYGRDNDGNLVSVSKKGKTEKIAKSGWSLVGFNSEGTEIMYTKDGKTYVSKNCNTDAVKVSGDGAYAVWTKDKKDETSKEGFYATDTFKKTVIITYDDDAMVASILSNKYEAEEVIGDITNLVGATKDLSKLYYVNDDDALCYVKVKKNAKEKELADDVENIRTDDNCENIYFTDEDEDTLYYIKGTSKPKEVKSVDIEECEEAFVVDGMFYYATEDDYYCVDGKKQTKLKVEDLDYSSLTNSVYGADEDKFYKVNGKKLKEIDKGDFEEIGDIDVY